MEKQYNPMKISELSKYTRRPFNFNYQHEKESFQKTDVQRLDSDIPWLDYINSHLKDYTDQVNMNKNLRDVDKTKVFVVTSGAWQLKSVSLMFLDPLYYEKLITIQFGIDHIAHRLQRRRE